MNGVIINDEHLHELAFAQATKAYGVNLSHQDYLSCCAGRTDEAGFQQIAAKFSVSLPIDQLLVEKSNYYQKLFPTHRQSYPGVIALIKRLAKHYPLALCSSSSQSEVKMVLEGFKIHNYFSVVVTANDITKGKPHPEPYLLTCRLLKQNPLNCLVIEDAISGVQAAKAAGCICLAVTTTHNQEDLQLADVVMTDFGAIPTNLSKLVPVK